MATPRSLGTFTFLASGQRHNFFLGKLSIENVCLCTVRGLLPGKLRGQRSQMTLLVSHEAAQRVSSYQYSFGLDVQVFANHSNHLERRYWPSRKQNERITGLPKTYCSPILTKPFLKVSTERFWTSLSNKQFLYCFSKEWQSYHFKHQRLSHSSVNVKVVWKWNLRYSYFFG